MIVLLRLLPLNQAPEEMAPRQGHRSPEAKQADGRSKGLPTDIAPVCAIQDHGTPPARTPQPGDRPDTAEGASRLPPREVDSRPGDPPHPGHRGHLPEG